MLTENQASQWTWTPILNTISSESREMKMQPPDGEICVQQARGSDSFYHYATPVLRMKGNGDEVPSMGGLLIYTTQKYTGEYLRPKVKLTSQIWNQRISFAPPRHFCIQHTHLKSPRSFSTWIGCSDLIGFWNHHRVPLPHQILAATQTRLRQEVQQYTAALLFPITGNFVFFRLGVNSSFTFPWGWKSR